MSMTEEKIQIIIQDMIKKLSSRNAEYTGTMGTSCSGCFRDVDEAVEAAKHSQKQLSSLSLEHRAKLIAAMRKAAMENVKRLLIL